MELRLYIDPDAPLSFVGPNIPPADAPDSYAWLTDIGDLTLQARTGQLRGAFSNPSASLVVRLDNCERQAAQLVGQPLRAIGEVWADEGELYFAGILQAIDYGTELTLTFEA